MEAGQKPASLFANVSTSHVFGRGILFTELVAAMSKFNKLSSGGKMLKVLVVEDCKYSRESLEAVLVELLPEGSALRIPESFEDARAFLCQEQYDVLFLDLYLHHWDPYLSSVQNDFIRESVWKQKAGGARIFCVAMDKCGFDEMNRVFGVEGTSVFMKRHINVKQFTWERKSFLFRT